LFLINTLRVKKMNDEKIADLKAKIKFTHDYFNQNTKIIIFSVLLLGFFNVCLYTVKNQIPFPIELSTLTSLLMVIAAMVIILNVLFSIIIMSPLLYHGNIFIDVYPEKSILSLANIKTFLSHSGIFLLIVIILPFIDFISPFKNFEWIWLITSILGLIITNCLVFKNINGKLEKGKKCFLFLLSALNIYSAIWIFLVIIFFPKIIPFTVSHYNYLPFGLMIIVANYLFMFPLKEKIAYFLIAGCFIMLVFGGSFFTKRALFLLKLGGEYKAVYNIDQSKENEFPKALLDNSKKGKTKELLILSNIGNTKYVKLSEDENNTVYGLKNSLISSEEILK